MRLAPPFRRLPLIAILAAAAARSSAQPLHIPNASFESPQTAFVDNRVDAWQKTPKPFWYDEGGGFTWDQLSGVFKNTEPGKDDHLENSDEAQAFYLFAVPSVGLFLDATSTQTTPLLASFEPGFSYTFTLAVQGGGGGMTNGATLELDLYYRDTLGAPQVIAATVVTNDAATFPSRHLLADFQVRTAAVKPTDPWAGKGIGLQILSTVNPAWAGGYWNIDNARIEAIPEPTLQSPEVTGGRLRFVVRSEPGLRFEVQRADALPAPADAWTTAGAVTNSTGLAEFSDAVADGVARFYRLRRLP